ncbi:hypothetical protein HG15A2_16060 [Adhaeretor mobilis]|uniref:Uncharacterized protein n=1 Tax=Adhaeretor mobilis TaxID=1930276 RepID=A0A517MTX9_9BACT|nr:hypothetical protein HG15A2_16060 [Adhaeretor mobilis]
MPPRVKSPQPSTSNASSTGHKFGAAFLLVERSVCPNSLRDLRQSNLLALPAGKNVVISKVYQPRATILLYKATTAQAVAQGARHSNRAVLQRESFDGK